MKLTRMGIFLAGCCFAAQADVVFVTPAGATTGGGPVDASAAIKTSPGQIMINLTNLEANPKDISQNLSDFQFTLSNGDLTGAALTGAGSQEITVNGNGTFSIGANLTTVAAVGWVFTASAPTGTLDVLSGPGHAGPAHMIIGPPGGPTYSNANGSIAGNGPNNPFLNQTASFTITAPDVTANTTVTAATFSFGVTSGILVPGTPSVPEPGFYGLLAAGLVGLLAVVQRRGRVGPSSRS